jgi:hypothetical protein
LLTQIEVVKSAIWVSQMRKLAGLKAQIERYQKRQLRCSKAQSVFKKRHLALEALYVKKIIYLLIYNDKDII